MPNFEKPSFRELQNELSSYCLDDKIILAHLIWISCTSTGIDSSFKSLNQEFETFLTRIGNLGYILFVVYHISPHIQAK